MKKLLIVLATIILVVSMSICATAEDRLKLDYGQFYIRGFSIYNPSYDSDAEADTAWWHMRFRNQWSYDVMEDIKVTLRYDIHEGDWGINTNAWGRADSATDFDRQFQVDRIYGRVDKPMFTFVGGQQYQSFGYDTAYSPQKLGFALRLKFPVVIDLNYFKDDEGTDASTNDEVDENKDTDIYAAQISITREQFKAGAYGVQKKDYSDADDSPYCIGLYGGMTLAGFDLKAAIDQFGGEQSDAVDYMGTQFWFSPSYNVNENIKAGAQVYYALARDDDTEVQLVDIADPFGGFWYHEKFGAVGEDALVAVIPNYSPFDPTGDGAGSQSFDAWVNYTLIEKITLGAQIGYYTPEDDGLTNIDSIVGVIMGAKYQFYPKMSLHVVGEYSSPKFDDDTADDPLYGVACQWTIDI